VCVVRLSKYSKGQEYLILKFIKFKQIFHINLMRRPNDAANLATMQNIVRCVETNKLLIFWLCGGCNCSSVPACCGIAIVACFQEYRRSHEKSRSSDDN
jgi:hypothetical protein